MARIKKYSPEQKLSSFQTFLVDDNPNSDYFRITEFKDTFTGGKNGFLIEGSEYLKESTEIKIEILDVEGNPIYYEPGNGIPEYYEGISKLVAVYVYNDTPIGLGKITILGELKEYEDNGVKRTIPDEWKGAYNVKWERTFQINKLLSNEDKVRFYRRPDVSIDEFVKPIFSGNPPTITQTGSLSGTPLAPAENQKLSNFSLPTSYRLNIDSGNKWTGSIVGQPINFTNIDYTPIVDDVVNETELIVSPPYTENDLAKSFNNEEYSISFPYIEGVSDLATALTGSFAKISITDMKTFVGDAARVKVFRRSQSNLTDFEFVQEIQLESNELLKDITTFDKKEENYGIFTEDILDSYWITSSNDFNISFNQNFLYNSVNLDSTPTNYFFTSESFSIRSGVEYSLDFNVRKETTDPNAYLKIFLSGSNNDKGVEQQIVNIPSSTFILQKTNFSENIVANDFDNAKLYFEVSGSDWYVNNVSLKASQETSFSPDEITFIQQVPKTLVSETFDYRFEFYDINNNYIPVRVEETKTFTGGNTNLFNKSLDITPDNLYFSFDSASNPANAVPPFIINFDVETNLVTGSITYTSGAYDFFGNEISQSEYAGGIYPGYLTNWDVDGGRQPFLRVQDFTGSRDDISVQFIRYNAEVEGVTDTFVITRVEDGKGGVSFEIVPFRGTQIKNKESKTLEVQALRVDGINRIDLRSGLDRGFSDAKLHLLSSSLDGTQTYVSLSQAITNTNFVEGISAGLTGSGEIDYNAIFTRDSIDNELTLYLMDGPTSESILTSLILTDLKDGLNPGLVQSTTEQFNIKYKPRELSPFNPQQSIVTASFQRRGTTLNPLSASLIIYPSSSIEPKTELPQFFMFYETGAFDDTITLNATDGLGNSIGSGIPGDSVTYYEADETKQLNLEFTYTEPITSASVTANKSFFITPDGLPGQDSIDIDIDPQPVALGSNHKGDVYNYGLANTDIQLRQGDLFLINTSSNDPGTFTTRSIVPTNIEFTSLVGDSTTTMSLAGFESMSALSASIRYDFDIYPYFTSSLITASRTQKFTKVVEGAGAIEVTLDPIAVSFNADESGFITNYSAAETEIIVKQNDEYLVYDSFNSGTPGTFVTASISASNITFTELSSSNLDSDVSGDEILHFKGFGGMARTDVSASVIYNLIAYPYALKAGVAGVPVRVSKKQTFSKVNDGSAARKVSLKATSDTVIYNGDGTKVAPNGDISLVASSVNTTGSAYYKFLNEEGGTIGASSTNSSLTLGDLPNAGTASSFTVELRDGNPNGLVLDTDSITISGVSEGSTVYSAQLSNPASSVTVEVDGTTYFDNTGTLIRAYKGGTELQFVEEYDEEALDPETFLPIGTFGQFSASIHDISSFLTHTNNRLVETTGELYASSSGTSDWNDPQSNTQGFIIYKIDFENGRATQFVQQSFSTVFEGATGPGVVFRGPWTGSIEYIYNKDSKRRDSVLWSENGLEPYDTYYATKDSGSSYLVPSGSGYEPTIGGALNDLYWESLGKEEFFVAAKIAIFEESFVKNTINVGEPLTDYDTNPQISIVGGTDEPYISIGQSIQGYGQQGAYIGVTKDGGPASSEGGLLSLSGDPTAGTYNSLKWDGETLLIRGAIRQTAAGLVEPSLRGLWQESVIYYPDDIVSNGGQSWLMAGEPHTSSLSHEPGIGVSYSESWSLNIASGSDGVNGEAAGVTYAGVWDDNIGGVYESGSTYMGEDTLKYVVKYGSDYYVSKISHTPRGLYNDISGETFYSEDTAGTYVPDVVRRNLNWYKVKAGQGPVTGVTPGVTAGWEDDWELIGGSITPGVWTDGWEAFGAQFTSVATDILFAEDVYANRTINIGTNEDNKPVIAINADSASGYQNPFISIGQSTPGFEEDGIFLGYSDTSASFSILSDVGAKVNIGGMNVDKEGLFFEETVELPPFTQVSSQRLFMIDTGSGGPSDGTDGFTFPDDIVNFGSVNYGTGLHSVIGISSSFAVQLEAAGAGYTPSITSWNIQYYSSSYETPVGGPATIIDTDIELHGWRNDPAQHPKQAPNETWFVDWSVSKNTTIGSYNFIYDSSGEGYNYLTLRTENLLQELGIADDEVAALRGDGKPFPSVGGGNEEHSTTAIYGLQPSGSMPILWIDTVKDDSDNFVWHSGSRAGYQIIDVVNSSNKDSTTGYDTLVVGKKVYPPSELATQNNFGSDFKEFADTYSVSSAQNGTAAVGGGVVNTSLFKNIQLSWVRYTTDDSSNYTNTEMGIGFLQGDPIELESIRIHSSGSNGNSRPYVSMGQLTQSYDENGVFMGYQAGSDIPVLSLKSSGNSLKWDGELLKINGRIEAGGLFGTGSVVEGSEIRIGDDGSGSYAFTVNTAGDVVAQSAIVRGTIEANDGNIGDWVVDADTKALRDSNNEVVFDPNLPEIGLFNINDGSKTVSIKPTGSLADPNASGTTISGIGTPSNYTNVTGTNTFPPTYGAYSYSATGSAGSTIPNGTYSLVFNMPTLEMSTSTTTAVSSTVSAPNYNATSENQMHGAPLQIRGSAGYEVWAELLDESGNVLQEQRLQVVNAFSSYEYGETYVAGGDGNEFGGGLIGPSSVTGDTLIHLADGTTKRADEIDENDWLLVWDEKNNKLVSHQIAEKRQRWVNEYYILRTKEREIKVSDTHGFYLDGGVEISIQDIIPNETEVYIYTDEGTMVKSLVLEVEYVNSTFDEIHVISFSTPPYKNYISDGILSHNYVTYPWEYYAATQFSAQSGTNFGQSVTRNFTFDQGDITYKMRYKWRGQASAGQKTDTGASLGSDTTTKVFQTSQASYATGIGSLPTSVSISVPTNITEVTGKGIQVLSGNNEYVRIEREAEGSNFLKIAGGNLLFGYDGDSSNYKIRPYESNRHDLGTAGERWRLIYSNQALNTSDRNLKKNILESDLGLSFINSLNPIKYHWLEDDNNSPYHYGLIAQEVDEVIPKESGSIVREDDGNWNMAYNQLISPMIKAIQQLSQKVSELESYISGSL